MAFHRPRVPTNEALELAARADALGATIARARDELDDALVQQRAITSRLVELGIPILIESMETTRRRRPDPIATFTSWVDSGRGARLALAGAAAMLLSVGVATAWVELTTDPPAPPAPVYVTLPTTYTTPVIRPPIALTAPPPVVIGPSVEPDPGIRLRR